MADSRDSILTSMRIRQVVKEIWCCHMLPIVFICKGVCREGIRESYMKGLSPEKVDPVQHLAKF